MDLTTSTLEHIEEKALAAAGKTLVKGEHGETFVIGENVHEYHQHWQADDAISTSTLSSVFEYITSGMDGRKEVIVHVESPIKVSLLGPLDEFGEREQLMIAKPVVDYPTFGRFVSREKMNIMLQALFVENTDQAAILSFIGNMTKDNSVQVQDDGVTQAATVKTGTATVGTAKVPNPVKLMPYRTFSEVKQPASDFIFRVDDDLNAALYEADGGAWQQEAINNIKSYFTEKFAMTSETGVKITILG